MRGALGLRCWIGSAAAGVLLSVLATATRAEEQLPLPPGEQLGPVTTAAAATGVKQSFAFEFELTQASDWPNMFAVLGPGFMLSELFPPYVSEGVRCVSCEAEGADGCVGCREDCQVAEDSVEPNVLASPRGWGWQPQPMGEVVQRLAPNSDQRLTAIAKELLEIRDALGPVTEGTCFGDGSREDRVLDKLTGRTRASRTQFARHIYDLASGLFAPQSETLPPPPGDERDQQAHANHPHSNYFDNSQPHAAQGRFSRPTFAPIPHDFAGDACAGHHYPAVATMPVDHDAFEDVAVLRDMSQELDNVANVLERRNLYERADEIRAMAQKLRHDARQMQTESPFVGAAHAAPVLPPYPTTR